MKKFLVVSPHPDDSDFGCAGTVAKLVQEGNEAEYLIVSDGSKGSHAVGFGGEKLAAMREEEQKAAARAVGVSQITFLREVDGEVENTQALRKRIIREVRRVKPNIVLSFDPANLLFDHVYRAHRDHRVVAETVFDALYPGAGSPAFFPELLGEGYAIHQVEEIWFFATPRPHKWVDITATLDKKVEALLAHASQHQDVKEVEERVRRRAEEEGKKQGCPYAECFRTLDFSP